MKRFLALFAVLAVASGSLFALQGALADEGDDVIPISGAWGTALNNTDDNGNSVLAYSISGASGEAMAAIQDGIEAWNAALDGPGLRLVPAASAKNAQIKIKYKNGGGMIAGQALRKTDRQGFVSSCDVSLSGRAFGQSALDTLEEVTTHELGHCLGLGHANFDDDLMSSTVNGVHEITACHVEGVRETNHWKLVDGLDTPHHPHVDHVHCSATP
jgi:hypothetical protein